MKIIEEKKWTRVITCKDCGSKLEVEEGDLTVGYFNGDYTEPGEKHPCAVCPSCGKYIKFSWYEISTNAYHKLMCK